MTLILSGTDGLSDVDGSAATPAIRGTDANTGIFFPAADTIAFSEGGVESMRIDSAGNMGLGVTPSAWSSYKAIQFGAQGSIASASTATYFGNNWFTDGTNKYIQSGTAGLAGWEGNVFKWYQAASGTAGGTVSFTQAMTLDASGNLGIGMTPSSTVRFDVSGPAASWGIRTRGGGNAGIPIASFADVNGAGEVRIDSSGNLLVGATSAHNFGIPSIQAGGSNANAIISVRRDTTSAADQILFYNPNGVVGTITSTGSATAYVTSSDYRLKENIAPMTGALSVVAQLKPCTYTWKVDGSDSQGFIAHELQAVVPDCVTGSKDAVDDEGNPKYQGVDTSFLVATLTAAIQEQQAIITTLTDRITALETPTGTQA
jgi:hypothetical protein